MAEFTRIDIHYRVNGVDAVASIDGSPATGRPQIDAIFLNGAEARFQLFKSGQPLNQKDREKPKGLAVRPASIAVGPSDVCYLENDVLKCWGSS